MTDHERGAYAPPTDPPLSFNPRQPVRRARAVPVTLIISVLVLAGLVAAVFVFYRAGVRQAGQPPQTVGEPIEAIRAPAPAEAQPQDPAAGLEIYRGGEGGSAAPATPKFTPPPEQPQARSAPRWWSPRRQGLARRLRLGRPRHRFQRPPPLVAR